MVALYEKSAGKAGKHASVTESSNIAAISYADLQLYDYSGGNHFSNATPETGMFMTNYFAKVPSAQFCCLLGKPVTQLGPGMGLNLHSDDMSQYKAL